MADDDVRDVLSATGFIKQSRIELMKQAKTPYEVLQISGLVDMKKFKDIADKVDIDLLELESRLDSEYFTHVLRFADSLPKSGKLFSEFLKNEMDILNIITLLKLKKIEMPPEKIKQYLIPPGLHLNERMLNKMAEANSFEDLIKLFRRTPYYNIIREFHEQKRSWLFFKAVLYAKLLKESVLLLHKNPLSIDTVLGFALMKEIEVNNIKTIVKGKQLDVESSIIEGALII